MSAQDAQTPSVAQALCQLATTRDEQAWCTLLTLHGADIQRACRRVLRERTLAEDACQETLLQIRACASQFSVRGEDPDMAAKVWILKIAYTTALQLLRSDKARRTREQNVARSWSAQPSAPPSADESDRLERVQHELAGLPEHDRTPIVLHFHEGLAYAQVAAALNCPVGTAKARVHRGLEKLRRRLAVLGLFVSCETLSQTLYSCAQATDSSALVPQQFDVWRNLLSSNRQPAFKLAENTGGWSFMAKAGVACATLAVLVLAFAMTERMYGGEAVPPQPSAPAPAQAGKAASKEEIALVVSATNAFAMELYKQQSQKDGNIVISPYSVACALAMVSAGARGNTADEIRKALHFSLPDERVHAVFGQLIQEQNDSKDRKYELAVANALWMHKDIGVHDSFLALIRSRYHASAEELDFAQATEDARRTINTWVAKNTHDKITELFSPGSLTRDTRLVLSNAVYFKGAWQRPFNAKYTREGDFLRTDGRRVKAQLMFDDEGTWQYAADEKTALLAMPYGRGELSMFLVQPRKAGEFGAMEKQLSAAAVDKQIAALKKMEHFRVLVPKFKQRYSVALNSALEKLGVVEALSLKADFSGINGKRDLLLSHAVHQALIEVDEKGTVAAATTGFELKLKDDSGFEANRPFVYFIRDNRSGLILFLGRVWDPTVE